MTIAPYVHQDWGTDQPAWQRVVADTAAKMNAAGEKERAVFRRLRIWLSGGDEKKWAWNRHWKRGARFQQQFYTPTWKAHPYEWCNRGMLMTHAGGRRCRIFCFMRAVEALKPRTVLEIGFGDGLNLITLANRFPDIRFAGLELAHSGVEEARRLQRQERLPDYLVEFSPEPALDVSAYQRIDFQQGSATVLPFADEEFDLILTCVALEQMDAVYDRVMGEIVRVSNRWVGMIEPFRNFNAEGLRLKHVTHRKYLSAVVDDLPAYALQPVFVTNDLPQKINLAAALVVARKTSGPVWRGKWGDRSPG